MGTGKLMWDGQEIMVTGWGWENLRERGGDGKIHWDAIGTGTIYFTVTLSSRNNAVRQPSDSSYNIVHRWLSTAPLQSQTTHLLMRRLKSTARRSSSLQFRLIQSRWQFAMYNEKSARRDANTARWPYNAELTLFAPPQTPSLGRRRAKI